MALSATSRGELRLHCEDADVAASTTDVLSSLAIEHVLDRDPTVLSGGEQAALAVAAARLMRPTGLAVDCIGEQLDPCRKARMFDVLQELASMGTGLWVADNRVREWSTDQVELGDTISLATNDNGPCEPIQPHHFSTAHVSTTRRLAVDNLSFAYRRQEPVLSRLSFELVPGRIYRLMGDNGAGKSTCAKILTGIYRPSRGFIYDGDARYDAWRTPGARISYHWQDPDDQLSMPSIEAEIVCRALLRAGNASAARDKASAMLSTFGLSAVRHVNPGDMPFSIRKRVALAAALSTGAPWLILDEPTLAQDDHSSEAIANIVQQYAASGAGIIVITHSSWFAELLSPHPIDLGTRTPSAIRRPAT